MLQPARRFRTILASLVLLAHLANSLVPAASLAQGAKPSNVQRGQEYYEQSRFDEAIGLLKDLVDRGALQGEDLQHARELLARSYVKKGYPVQGKEMFKGILRASPTWRPDPIRVPPDETAVFEQALREFTAESAGGTPPVPGQPGTPAVTTPTTPPVTPPPAVRPAPTPASSIVPSAAKSEGKKSKKVWYIVGGAVVLGG
ncbi:MAG: hypothetical protein ABIS67_08135, partial [Candidatus Eisenbacteria bacterium]